MLAHYSPFQITEKLASGGLSLRIGALAFRINARKVDIADRLHLLYGEYSVLDDDTFHDFSVTLNPLRSNWGGPADKVEFRYGNMRPFHPLPLAHAFPLLEWGMNWCVATTMHCWLIIHAAVLERNGACVILPGRPGAGKSTLTAVLAGKGWNVLSDEHAILDLSTGALIPSPRPISLKNASIPLVRSLLPQAVISEAVTDTHKGTISHMKVTSSSLVDIVRPCFPRWIVFPEFGAGFDTELVPASRPDAVVHLAENAFNYGIHGARGFNAVVDMVECCDVFDLKYGSVVEAAALVELLQG